MISAVVPAYASTPVLWDAYYNIVSSGSAPSGDKTYKLEFKSDTAKANYEALSKKEKRIVDMAAFAEMQTKDQNVQYGTNVLENTTFPDIIRGIVGASQMSLGDLIANNVVDNLSRYQAVSDKISESNRKFGGGGMSFKLPTSAANYGTGALTLSKGFINDLRSNIAEFDNYTIYPALSENVAYYPSLIGAVNFTSYNKEFTDSFLKNHYNVFYENDTKHTSYMAVYFCGNSDDLIYYFKQSGLLSYGYRKSDGTYTFAEVQGGYKLSAYEDDSLQYVLK